MRITRSALAAAVAGAAVLASGAPAFSAGVADDHRHGLPDRDSRKGKIRPSANQRADAQSLGARVAWNQFGTPSSMVDPSGAIATGVQGDTPEAAARAWLEANKQLFKLSSTDNLQLVSAAPLAGGAGHAVTLRQTVGGLKASGGGLVTIGVKRANGWSVISASSTIHGDETLAAKPSIGPEQAVQKAAANAGEQRSLAQIVPMKKRSAGFETFRFAGVEDAQRAKPVAFPTLDGFVPAYETIVSDTDGAEPSAYRMFVDGRSGAILARESLVHQAVEAESQAAPVTETFNGTLPAEDGGCGPRHGPYTVAEGSNIRAIDVFANADAPLQDIVLHLDRGDTRVASADTLFTPEQIRYAPQGGVPAGDYFVVVCEFDDNAPPVEPRTYSGRITLDDTPAPAAFTARWRVFPGVPLHNQLAMDPWNNPSTDVREDWCWRAGANAADCDEIVGNLASRAPWDHNVKANAPTFTTIGNNARTAESWTHSLLPSPTQFRPTSTQRDYTFPWSNSWYEEDCDPGTPYGANFVPGQSFDISAAVTNLFVQHNRMHDWSYFLGFTEENWNAQDSNFGATEAFRENDPLVGDAQAGALGAPPGTGTARNNANMITLPEGVSSITNMYLWQPQAGAFYPPCVDGDYDAGVIGHEYGHMIENRMIGKGSNRSGFHAGAMGESTSDLMAIEQLNEHGNYPRDANRWAAGTYATGNKERGIRNYAGNWPRVGAFPAPSVDPEVDPLNLSDLGYDVVGSTPSSPHPDGELWTATNFDLRNALVQKYNGQYPESDQALQEQCAKGQVAVDRCPGNRRWIQLVFDSYLLMTPAPSMVDARNAILAADQMRFGGANQNELWLAFARRGFGRNAASSNTTGRPAGNENESDPLPDFEAPGQNNATLRFVVRSTEGDLIDANVFVGHHEARVSPIADTNPATNAPATAPSNNLDDRANFAPGTYEFIATARGYGAVRFREDIRPGQFRTIRLDMASNVASRSQGATASGDAAPVTNGPREVLSAAAVRENLIDDTEETHWQAAADQGPNGHSVDGRQVTVDLAGTSPHRVNRVQVSAMLGPVFDAGPPASDLTQNRFTALRQFELWACNARQSNCSSDAGFSRVYTSAANAFPSGTPRPVSPTLLLREFTFAATRMTHLRLVAKHSQCTGGPEYQGEQDEDPHSATDCNQAGPAATRFVRAAELQAFERASGVR